MPLTATSRAIRAIPMPPPAHSDAWATGWTIKPQHHAQARSLGLDVEAQARTFHFVAIALNHPIQDPDHAFVDWLRDRGRRGGWRAQDRTPGTAP